MHTSYKRILSVLLGGLITSSLLSPSVVAAASQDTKKPLSASSSTEASESSAGSPSTSDSDRLSHKPGPAWKTIGGTVKRITGEIYTVEDYDGNQMQLYVSRETKRLRGQQKVGDRVRAEITRDGFANSIQ